MKSPDDQTRVAGVNGTVERSDSTVPRPPWSDPERAARTARQIHLNHQQQQRRWTKALDQHLGIERPVVDLTAVSPDYWADCHMDKSLQWREFHGRRAVAP